MHRYIGFSVLFLVATCIARTEDESLSHRGKLIERKHGYSVEKKAEPKTSRKQESEKPPAFFDEFCKESKFNYGDQFYGEFVYRSSSRKLKYNITYPYRELYFKELGKFWREECGKINDLESAKNLIDRARELCLAKAAEKVQSLSWDDFWFESNRKAAMKKMEEEVKEVCQYTVPRVLDAYIEFFESSKKTQPSK
jgi:hypothetical protein